MSAVGTEAVTGCDGRGTPRARGFRRRHRGAARRAEAVARDNRVGALHAGRDGGTHNVFTSRSRHPCSSTTRASPAALTTPSSPRKRPCQCTCPALAFPDVASLGTATPDLSCGAAVDSIGEPGARMGKLLTATNRTGQRQGLPRRTRTFIAHHCLLALRSRRCDTGSRRCDDRTPDQPEEHPCPAMTRRTPLVTRRRRRPR